LYSKSSYRSKPRLSFLVHAAIINAFEDSSCSSVGPLAGFVERGNETQNYWGFELCPSSGILEARPQVGVRHLLCWVP
jgi:hypothetical protein